MENNLFKRYEINFDKLLLYGFIKDNGIFYYTKNILDNSLKVEIYINKYENVSSKIIDLEFNDEYVNHKIEENDGPYVNMVRSELEKILLDIRNKCCNIKYFIYSQSNRITNKLIEKYKTMPEFLWDSSPDAGVFRIEENRKWYAIIMNINKSKISNEDKDVEIINVKLDEKEIDDLVLFDGFYRAYHMNKKKWITIILDDTLDDEKILSYIDKSYILNRR